MPEGEMTKFRASIVCEPTLALCTKELDLGNYLYIPVHVIPETKLKELGKHVSNIVIISQDEKVLDSIILDNKNSDVTVTTKMGMIKRVKLKDLEVTRYTKPLTLIKLKDTDEVVSVKRTLDKVVLVTENGYYLVYDVNEISIIGPKAAGVKAMNVKDDIIVCADQIDENTEYINVLTNFNTIKRVKVNELTILTRGKKGNMIFKKVKTKDYKVFTAYVSNSKTINIMKCDSEITEIKNSDIPIMDLSSVGSSLTKKKLEELKPKNDVFTLKETEVKEEKPIDAQAQLSFDDFINDFKI